MGAVVEFFLTVASHDSVLVVEEMVFESGAELLGELIADGCHEE